MRLPDPDSWIELWEPEQVNGLILPAAAWRVTPLRQIRHRHEGIGRQPRNAFDGAVLKLPFVLFLLLRLPGLSPGKLVQPPTSRDGPIASAQRSQPQL